MPDLSTSLDEYSRNVNTMIDIAEAHNVRLILVTQPTMWHRDLTNEEKNLLWFGWDADTFYTFDALADGIAAYNQTLLEICNQRQVECIDLANTLPKNQTIFYDDMHFNENGARQVADIIAGYIQSRQLFTLNY